jgi:hypothetical protein
MTFTSLNGTKGIAEFGALTSTACNLSFGVVINYETVGVLPEWGLLPASTWP